MDAQAALISPRSRLAVAFMAIFIGLLGVHRFYLGKTNTGIGMFALFLAGWSFIWIFPLGIGIWVVLSIWALYDIVTIIIGEIKDSDGLPVTRW